MKHLICGDSAGGSLKRYLQTDDIIRLRDPLVPGPLLSVTNGPESFVRARAEFWRTIYDDSSMPVEDDYAAFFDRLRNADGLTIWLSPGTHDQIMWGWLIHVLPQLDIALDKVRIKYLHHKDAVQFRWMGLGILKAEQFALCQDLAIGSKDIETFREAYSLLCLSDPRKLDDFCRRETTGPPDLQPAFKACRLLYPDFRTGLSIFDEAMLRSCEEGKPLKTARVVAAGLMETGEGGYLTIGDLVLTSRLESMAAARHPAVRFAGQQDSERFLHDTTTELNPLGREILTGHRNYVQLNGIDQWIGGIHLRADDASGVWFRDGDRLVQGAGF